MCVMRRANRDVGMARNVRKRTLRKLKAILAPVTYWEKKIERGKVFEGGVELINRRYGANCVLYLFTIRIYSLALRQFCSAVLVRDHHQGLGKTLFPET